MNSPPASNIPIGELVAEALYLIVAKALTPDTTRGGATLHPPFSTMSQDDWVEAVRLWNAKGRPLISQMAKRGCPACGTKKLGRLIFESYDGYGFHECEDCACWFVPRQVNAEVFDRFFDANPEAMEVAQRSFQKRLSEENFQADLDRFGDYFKNITPLFSSLSGLRYLDIGCGLGHSLISAKKFGMEPCGIESSSECIRLGKSRGLPIYKIGEELPHKTFDLISFWESLEHISDPCSSLSECTSLLSQDGIVVFTLPNLNSPLLRLQRADCSVVHGGYDTPGHINLFAPSHLHNLFHRAGLSILHLDGRYSDSLPEGLSYLIGKNLGAKDLLNRKDIDADLSETCLSVLEHLSTPFALLERATLTSPILFGIACRSSALSQFKAGQQEVLRLRDEEILQLIINHLPSNLSLIAELGTNPASSPVEVVFDAIAKRKDRRIAELTDAVSAKAKTIQKTLEEVTKRDRLLSSLQLEVDRRDALLVDRALNFQAVLSAAQGEIAKRDELLVAIQEEVNRRDVLLAEQSQRFEKHLSVIQDEVTKRDELLMMTQQEVNRRDELLVEQSQDFKKALSVAQDEIAKRDDLLMVTQQEVNRRDELLAEQSHEFEKALLVAQNEISARDNLIASSQQEVVRYSHILEDKVTELEEMQSRLSEQGQLLATREQKLSEVTRVLAEKEKHICSQVEQSLRSWMRYFRGR